MNFLAGVNRVLRSEGILRDDDDELTSFTTTAFAASLEFAKLAIQDELTQLVAENLIPYEEKDATVTLVSGTRLYALASDFVRMRDPRPFLLRVDGSGVSMDERLFEWPGGESRLRQQALNYRDESGESSYWYIPGGTTKQIGFYTVPDSTSDGRIYRYYYEGAQTVTDTTDMLPFASEQEAEMFIRVACRRFKYLRMDPATRNAMYPGGITSDPERNSAKSDLFSLFRIKPPTGRYGRAVRTYL